MEVKPRQVGLARNALAGWLEGRPRADEAVLVASEPPQLRERDDDGGLAAEVDHLVRFVRSG